MKNLQQQEIERWIGAWRRASISLIEAKKSELRSKDYYEKNRIILDEMLQYSCDYSKVRLSSGLIEQQRLFLKMKENTVKRDNGL